MFQDSESQIFVFVDQIDGSIDVQQVVIRDFLTVNLIEHGVQISVEITFLMRVFTVTELLLVVYRTTESRTFAGIEIIEDS